MRKATIGVWHASCSCRMGRADDPMAVVDTQGRVKGVQGLRVVDASIFPVVPCANTNFPVADDGGEDRGSDDAVIGREFPDQTNLGASSAQKARNTR